MYVSLYQEKQKHITLSSKLNKACVMLSSLKIIPAYILSNGPYLEHFITTRAHFLTPADSSASVYNVTNLSNLTEQGNVVVAVGWY